MFIERPLAQLPAADAERFVRALLSPDAADDLIDRADPSLHAIGVQTVAVRWEDAGGAGAFKPLALFGYCELAEHPLGARIARGLPKRYAGPFGIAHSIGVLAPTAGVDFEKTIFLSLAHAALAAGHQQLVMITDRVRAERYSRFGIELLPGLLHHRGNIVGVFDLAAKRAQLDAIDALELAA
jgi:hypothetical protein